MEWIYFGGAFLVFLTIGILVNENRIRKHENNTDSSIKFLSSMVDDNRKDTRKLQREVKELQRIYIPEKEIVNVLELYDDKTAKGYHLLWQYLNNILYLDQSKEYFLDVHNPSKPYVE